MILAIDPSFKGFAFSVTNDAEEVIFTKKVGTDIEDYRKTITGIQNAAFDVMSKFKEALSSLCKEHGVGWFDYTIVEYPSLQTRSGAELAVLNGMLAQFLKGSKFGMVYWVPPSACNARCGNRTNTKSYIVDWARKEYGLPPKKRISNDECTCLVFAKIMKEIIQGTYKNSYFRASDEYHLDTDTWIP